MGVPFFVFILLVFFRVWWMGDSVEKKTFPLVSLSLSLSLRVGGFKFVNIVHIARMNHEKAALGCLTILAVLRSLSLGIFLSNALKNHKRK